MDESPDGEDGHSWLLSALVILAGGMLAEHFQMKPMAMLCASYRMYLWERPDSIITLVNVFGWLGEVFMCLPGQLLYHGIKRVIYVSWIRRLE